MSLSDKEQNERDDRQPKEEEDRNKNPKTISQWQELISQRIEEAASQGAFENLRGQGKPLDLRKNPFAPQGKELAFDLLQNNDLAPAWILERKEVLALVADLRVRLQKDISYYRTESGQTDVTDLTIEEIFPAIRLEKWQTEIIELNKKIDTLNLSQPIEHLEVLKLRLADELKI